MSWLVERKEAISAINKVRGLGFGDAKLVYEEISKVMFNQYLTDENIKMIQEINNLGDDFRIHINMLKNYKIIHVETPIVNNDEYELEKKARVKKFEEAMDWMETLGEKEQEMIRTLIQDRYIYFG